MNRNSLARSVMLLILAAAVLAAFGALTLQRRESALYWRSEAQRATDALASLEAVSSRTSEAERDRFGYAVTGDKTLLDQARDTLAEASEERDKLSLRLSATAAQRQRLEMLTGFLKDAADLRLPGEVSAPPPAAAPTTEAKTTATRGKALPSHAKKAAPSHGKKTAAKTASTPSVESPVLTLPKVRELGDLTRDYLRELSQAEADARLRAMDKARSADRASDWLLLGGGALALVLGFLGTVGLRDEAGRLQTFLAVKETSLADAQEMLQNVDDGLALFDPSNGAVTAANDRFASITGYPRGQLLDGLLRPLLPADPDSPSGDVLRLLARTVRDGSVTVKVRIHPRTGADKLVRAAFRRLAVSGQTRVLGVFSDISSLETERIQAEEERDHLRQFLLPSSSPALLLDPEQGRVVDATPNAAVLFGADKDDLISGRLDPLAPGDPPYSREALLSHFEKAVNLEPQSFEWSAPDRRGQRLSLAVSLQRLTVAGQDRLLAVLRDLSVEKQLRTDLKEFRAKAEAAVQSERSLKQQLAAVSEADKRQKEELARAKGEVSQAKEEISRSKDELRRLAEEHNRALHEQNQSSRPFSSISGVVFSIGLDGAYRLLEGRDLLQLGLAPGELVGRKAAETPRGPLHSLPLIQRALSGESFTALEETNGLVWELRLSPLKDASEHPDGCVGTAQDVTEREKTREAAKIRMDSLVALLEASPEAFFLSDREGHITFACGAGFAGLGLSPWEAQGKSLEEISPAPDVWRASRQKAILEGSASWSWETPSETFKGFIASLKPNASDPPLLGAILRPSGSAKQAEPPYAWKGVSEAAPAAILVLNPEGRVQGLNASALQILKRTEVECLGVPWSSLAPETDREVWETFLDKTRAGETGPFPLSFHPSEGPEVSWEAAAAPLPAADGKNAWVVTLRPAPPKAPEPKALDSFLKLERSQREILQATAPSVSKILADISDIRRNTVGLKEKAGWAINPDGLNHINELEEAAQDAAERLEGWFDYEMAMTRDLHYSAVDLGVTAKETAEIHKDRFERTGAVLSVGDLPMIEADPDFLHLMFRNLYDFALSQAPAGKPLEINVQGTVVRAPGKSSSPGWCQLSLDFAGPETTEADLEHLFQAAVKPKEGLPVGGLGLLTVRRIAERHGGTVSAQPRSGGGTLLIVVLPLLAPKA